MRTFTGCLLARFLLHFLLCLTTSMIFVLLGSSKVTYWPSGVMRPKVVVVVVTGHSVVYVFVFVVVVLVVFSSGCDVSVVSRFAVWVVRHPASTRVPFQVLLDVVVVVVCVVLVVWSDWAHRNPANNGITAMLVSFFIVPSYAFEQCSARTEMQQTAFPSGSRGLFGPAGLLAGPRSDGPFALSVHYRTAVREPSSPSRTPRRVRRSD